MKTKEQQDIEAEQRKLLRSRFADRLRKPFLEAYKDFGVPTCPSDYDQGCPRCRGEGLIFVDEFGSSNFSGLKCPDCETWRSHEDRK